MTRRQDVYFRIMEQKRFERFSKKAEQRRAEELLAAASGISDRSIVCELRTLGYTPETVCLFTLMPLVHMAWQSGSVKPREREIILEAARDRGVTEDSAAYRKLMNWLDLCPPEAFFNKTFDLVVMWLESQPSREQQVRKYLLLSGCKKVAAACGGVLGIGSRISQAEWQLLQEMTARLSHSPESGSAA